MFSSAYGQEVTARLGSSFSSIVAGREFSYPGYTFTMRSGIIAGVGVRFPVSTLIDVSSEVVFHQRGWKDQIKINGNLIRDNVTINYLEIPITGRFKWRNLYAVAGPTAAIGLGGKLTQRSYGLSTEYEVKFGRYPAGGSRDYYIHHRYDFGFVAGIGCQLLRFATIDVRYGRSLTDFMADDSQSKNTTKHYSLQVTAGVTVWKKKSDQ